MAEIPAGIFPDVGIAYNVQRLEDHATQVLRALNGREQRRSLIAASGQRLFTASSMPLPQADRKFVQDFLHARRGKRDAFYFFSPVPAQQDDVAAGTASAQSIIIVPFTVLNAFDNVIGTLTDVRVAGVPKAFTRRDLNSRIGRHIAPRFYVAAASYVDCGTSGTLRSNDFTLTMWIRPIAHAADSYVVMNEVFNASGISLTLSGGAHLTLVARTNQAGANTVSTGPTLTADVWQHVAVTKSGTACTFSVNGVSSAGAGTLTDPVTTGAAWRMSHSSAPFDGMLSDVRFYNAAQSGGTIVDIYNGVTLPGNANLTGWWKLGEGTGITAADSSGFGNTGTLKDATLPTWCAGEAEITFTGGAQTGAVTLTGILRERIVARSDSDRIKQAFYGSADVQAIFDIAILELI